METGKLVWFDLTAPDTEKIRDFYAQVVGWRPKDHDQGDYVDFDMLLPGTDHVTTGICHPRGQNAAIPPQWVLYITVDDLDKRVQACTDLGGEVVAGPFSYGSSRYTIIKDPVGAVMALFEQGE